MTSIEWWLYKGNEQTFVRFQVSLIQFARILAAHFECSDYLPVPPSLPLFVYLHSPVQCIEMGINSYSIVFPPSVCLDPSSLGHCGGTELAPSSFDVGCFAINLAIRQFDSFLVTNLITDTVRHHFELQPLCLSLCCANETEFLSAAG